MGSEVNIVVFVGDTRYDMDELPTYTLSFTKLTGWQLRKYCLRGSILVGEGNGKESFVVMLGSQCIVRSLGHGL